MATVETPSHRSPPQQRPQDTTNAQWQAPRQADKKEKGLLGRLVRNLSLKARSNPYKWQQQFGGRVSDGETITRRRRSGDDTSLRAQRRQQRLSGLCSGSKVAPGTRVRWEDEPGAFQPLQQPASHPPSTAAAEQNRLKQSQPGPPRTRTPTGRWPPPTMSADMEMSPTEAARLISLGAPSFKGHKRKIPHSSSEHHALYVTSAKDHPQAGRDMVSLHESMTQLMTMKMQGHGYAAQAWDTLEQPSYAFYYGKSPGTITLNQWACMSSTFSPPIAMRDPGVHPRAMDLRQVMERLQELQAGLEEDDEELLYKITYRRVLRDPDKLLKPHKTLDKQITDLILVLSGPDWIDLTNAKNQVVTRFIFNNGGGGGGGGGHDSMDGVSAERRARHEAQYLRFMHQLLLSLELELRIHSKLHGDKVKEKLVQQMPPKIQSNLALARRWKDYVRVVDFGSAPEDVVLRYKLKRRQVKVLSKFARQMKWPNLTQTLEMLQQKDHDGSLDQISSDAFAFFSGLVLPGPTFPFLVMNALIDLDPDPATDALALLSPLHPDCGFQYRSSHTYWSASCIVGKVLAPTCRAVAGWVGPGRPTSDLGRNQIVRIRTRQPKQALSPEDIESMAERSDALGPADDTYPVGDYASVELDDDHVVDAVRIELLGFKRVEGDESRPGFAMSSCSGPGTFTATIQFAINGVSWPLRLMYNVSFISAWPCAEGPHPLFFDYGYQMTPVDELVNVRNWGGLYGGWENLQSARSTPAPAAAAATPEESRACRHKEPVNGKGADEDDYDDETVLVVDARGVRDNEVLARAWCAHWGLSGLVADVNQTCIACAVREAYAATVTVVIVVDDELRDQDDDHDDDI